jgi:hypothetical protein
VSIDLSHPSSSRLTTGGSRDRPLLAPKASARQHRLGMGEIPARRDGPLLPGFATLNNAVGIKGANREFCFYVLRLIAAVGGVCGSTPPRSRGPWGLLACISVAAAAGWTTHIKAYERLLPPEVVDRLNIALGSANTES